MALDAAIDHGVPAISVLRHMRRRAELAHHRDKARVW